MPYVLLKEGSGGKHATIEQGVPVFALKPTDAHVKHIEEYSDASIVVSILYLVSYLHIFILPHNHSYSLSRLSISHQLK